jgi:hypothetical protein
MKEHRMSDPITAAGRAGTLSEASRALAVRTQIAGHDLAGRLGSRLRAASSEDDRGSMTAEYAMVGGVGAAAAGALITCFKQRDVIERILELAIQVISRAIRSWW